MYTNKLTLTCVFVHTKPLRSFGGKTDFISIFCCFERFIRIVCCLLLFFRCLIFSYSSSKPLYILPYCPIDNVHFLRISLDYHRTKGASEHECVRTASVFLFKWSGAFYKKLFFFCLFVIMMLLACCQGNPRIYV